MGYHAVCIDTEGNVFGLFEDDPQAKWKEASQANPELSGLYVIIFALPAEM
jgi:hypothetical protein